MVRAKRAAHTAAAATTEEKNAADDLEAFYSLDVNTLVGRYVVFSGANGDSCKLQLYTTRTAFDPNNNDDWRARAFTTTEPAGKKLSFYMVPAAVGHAEIETGFVGGRFRCGNYPPIRPPTDFVPQQSGAEYKINLAGNVMGMEKSGKLNFSKIFNEQAAQQRWVRKMLDIEYVVLRIMFEIADCSKVGRDSAYQRAVDVIARETPEWCELVYKARPKVVNAIKAQLVSDKEFNVKFTNIHVREYLAASKSLFFIPRDHVEKNEDDVDCYRELETNELVPVAEMRFREGTPKYWGVPVQTRCYVNAERFDPSKQQKKDGAKAAGNADSGSHPEPSPAAKAAKQSDDADASSAAAAAKAPAAAPVKDEGPSRIRTNLGQLEVPGKAMKALPIKVMTYELVKTIVNGKPKTVSTPVEIDVTSHPNTHAPIGRDLKAEHYESAVKILSRQGGAVVPGDVVDIAFIPEGFDGKKNWHMKLEMQLVRRLGEGPGQTFTKPGPKGAPNAMAAAYASAADEGDYEQEDDGAGVAVKYSEEYNDYLMQEAAARAEKEHSNRRKRDENTQDDSNTPKEPDSDNGSDGGSDAPSGDDAAATE